MINAVALSGGPDSLCAMALMPKGLALIVDHGLRPESKKEAAIAAGMARDFGHEPHILSWNPKGLPRNQAVYRAGRYSELSTACEMFGVTELWTGHHQDDQMETLLLRLSKGSGLLGLSGMARKTWIGNTPLFRPLLTSSKGKILKWLKDRGLNGIKDPSNNDLSYPRVQWRKFLERQPMTPDISLQMGRIRNKALSEITEDMVKVIRPGQLRVSDSVQNMTRAALKLLLSEAVRWVGAKPYASVEGAIDFVLSPRRSGEKFATGGALIKWERPDSCFTISPESRGVASQVEILDLRARHKTSWIVPDQMHNGGLILGDKPRFDHSFATKSTSCALTN